MKKSVPGMRIMITGHPVVRFITRFAPLLVFLVLSGTAPSFPENTAKGVHIVELKTQAGLVKVFLPDDISAGDTVSASVALYPGGVTAEAVNRNLAMLKSCIIETSFFKVPASQKSIKINVPRNSAGTEMKFTLRNASMKVLDSVSVPISLSAASRGSSEAPSPYDYQCPLVGQAGRVVEIKGPFDGDFATTDFKIGNKKANVIAESPRKLVFESPSDVIGSVEVVLVERNVEVRRPFTCLQVLKIGEGDAVPVVSGSAAGPAVPQDREMRATEPGIAERELPPATQSLEFGSIKAEENLPPPERTAEAPAQALVPGYRNEEMRIILANQMESPVSLEGSLSAAPAESEVAEPAAEEESAPSAREGESIVEAPIETAPVKKPEQDSQILTPTGSDGENASGIVPGGSTAAVLEGQLLASFTGGALEDGVSDAVKQPEAQPPAEAEPRGKFTVQVASYREKQDAYVLADRLTRKGYQAFVSEANLPGKGKWYRVRVGRFGTRKEASSFGESLKRNESFIKSVYVAEDE
ncbi:MAG: SPOR domain-containing protein [Thermodesulfobacteriota bacterium]